MRNSGPNSRSSVPSRSHPRGLSSLPAVPLPDIHQLDFPPLSYPGSAPQSRYKSGFLTASANFSSDTGIADWVVLKPTNEADLPTWNLGYYKAYGPVMQGYPLDRTAASIMLEGSNIPERVDLMREMLAWRSSGATGLSISAQDVYQQIVRPVTAFASLIFYRPPGAAANESIVTGSVFFNFLWETARAVPGSQRVLGCTCHSAGGPSQSAFLADTCAEFFFFCSSPPHRHRSTSRRSSLTGRRCRSCCFLPLATSTSRP